MSVIKFLPLDLGSALLGGFFQALFDRLLPHSWPHIFVPEHEVQSVLNKWSTKLAMIQAVLDDAEKKQLTNMAVKVWLEDLQEFAYDLEDMLDEYNTTILERNSNARPSTDDDIISIAREELALLLDRLDAISNSGSMAQRLEELCERRSLLELLERTVGGTSTAAVWQRPPSTCVPTKPAVYGRDEDKSKILQMIARDDSTCSVISIVGMAGVGKTTLAQAVYNDTDFDRKAWVCISNDFDVFKISMAILESITHSSYDLKNLNEVQVQLKLAIAGRRFLIVLDDVWSKNYNLWETLKSPFVTGARGSRIIVTTRSIDVALKAGGPNDYYDLKLLSDEDCWSVFTKHAIFEDIGAHSNLEAVREKVVKKCGGLPLAARTLGGLLRSKERNDEWEDILNSKIWDLPEESDILPVLKLSYYHLPSHLKRCLAYCAVLPKNYEFEEKELVLLWMAEGLVLPSANNKQLEDIGTDYFRDLLSRSFFQKSSVDHTSKFVMHNLVNDLAQWTSGETVFKLEDKSEANTQSRRFRRARHSSYICSDFDGKKRFEVFDKVENLRTILPVLTQNRDCFIKDTVLLDLLSKFKKLRVLSLRRYNISELPEESISNLRYLRYLNLSDTKIVRLPQSINELYNLQILLLRNCSLLGDLPSSMGNLINLLHLDIRGASSISKMPCGMERLENLQTLSDFIVSKNIHSGSDLKELKNLKLLRGELRISPLQNVNNPLELRGGILSDKKNLQVLILEWGSGCGNSRDKTGEKYVLDMLRPHTNLTKLTIKHYGGLEFPFWIGDPIYLSNMVVLRLEECKNCTSLPPLGLLGSLKDLTVCGMTTLKRISRTFYGGERCSRPFQSLETLRLENLEKLEELEVCDTIINNKQVKVFQCLGELCIVNCPLLSGRLPEDLPKLQKLVIQICPALVISFSSFPMLCELEIDESRGMGAAVWRVEDLKVKNCPIPFLELFSPSRLTALEIEACSGLTSLQTAMQSSTCLRRLKIEGCNSLEFIVLDGSSCQASRLEHLYISGCPSLRSLVEKGQLPETLKYLKIKDCSMLNTLSSGQLPETLKHLEIKDCSMLNTLSSSGQLPTSLERFEINNCGIISIPFGQHNYGSLREIEISNCIQLGEFLGGGLQMTNLRKFSVSYCQNLVALPSSMHYFYYLEELRVFKCSSLNTIALQQISLPINLTSLKIEGDALYDSLVKWGLHKLTSLRKLVISGCTNETHFPRLDTMLPASLNDLSLANFSNLTTLSFQGFQNLTSLEYFTISNCRNDIRNFPRDLPSSLLKLEVFHCADLLERRIASRGGERRPSIANIPFVKIGGVLI